MFFFFTCGTHTFKSRLAGFENLTVQCQNCGNQTGHVYKRWEWFTFCFVPLIPFSLKPYKEVVCHICNFYQDIKYRPDVLAQMGLDAGPGGPGGPGGPPAQQGPGYAMHPPGQPQGQGGHPQQYK